METLAGNQKLIGPRGASDKRRCRRNEPLKELSVVWRDGGPEWTSCVRDLSLSGAFVQSSKPAPEGNLLTLRFRVSGRVANARAVVRRSVPGQGMGIEFLTIEQEDRALLALAADLTDEQLSALHSPSGANSPQESLNRQDDPADSETHYKARARVRVKVTARVEVKDLNSGECFSARLGSLSAGGCLLQFSGNLPVSLGTPIAVTITRGTESFRSQAKVIYTVPSNGIGVIFTNTDAEQLRILGTWIMETTWLAADRRRNQRVCLSVPVMVTGHDVFGAPFTENTHTTRVNADGCSLALSALLNKGHSVTLMNTRTLAMAECVVVRIEKSADTRAEIATSFLLPNKKFWQVNFPPVDC
jgi:hypothetical protein